MEEIESQLKKIYAQDLEKRRNWYSNVATAYDQARPRYPIELVNRAVEIAKLPDKACILELGCGPGNATEAFAKLGFSMLCLEPSREACEKARKNCASYPQVKFQETTFEEWELVSPKFDAVLAATSFHWIDPQIGCTKSAEALKERGSLILMWNMTPQPIYPVYQDLEPIYQIHAPSLARYENKITQAQIAEHLGEKAIACGKFVNLVSEQVLCEVIYSVDNFLLLLSTLSVYLNLDVETRTALFRDLREKIVADYDGSIPIQYLSVLQVAEKV
jgi:SAM-dependent methyltransferase